MTTGPVKTIRIAAGKLIPVVLESFDIMRVILWLAKLCRGMNAEIDRGHEWGSAGLRCGAMS